MCWSYRSIQILRYQIYHLFYYSLVAGALMPDAVVFLVSGRTE
jgi:hypothetical protein